MFANYLPQDGSSVCLPRSSCCSAYNSVTQHTVSHPSDPESSIRSSFDCMYLWLCMATCN